MRDVVKVFKALSDPNRLRILKMLQKKPLCVCEITSILNLATSTVSRHLYLLREANLIVDVKEGKWVNYKLNLGPKRVYVSEILKLLSTWLAENQVVRADQEKVRTTNRLKICGTRTI
jgi:ArsR family transcriptional regulator, arsenate/arsenite/antimonite-responsive transcriptional repressor